MLNGVAKPAGEEYRVEKLKALATVRLISGEVLSGALFLEQQAESHPGPQRPVDVIDSDRAFIPFLRDSDGQVVLLNRDAIIEVLLLDAVDIPSDALSRLVSMRIYFIDGRALEGTAQHALPPSHCRVSDFLNAGSRFLQLESEDGRHLINKAFILKAESPVE